MKKSANANSSNNCFSCIFRRMLCAGSLPTHPSDQLNEFNTSQSFDDDHKALATETKVSLKQTSSSPSVVARLMGLDSFPDTPLHPKGRPLASFFRSRSVNSIDFCLIFDHPTKQRLHHRHHTRNQHRRVRTSVSFREGLGDDFGLVFKLSEIDEEGPEHHQEEELMGQSRPKENVNCFRDQKEKGLRNEKKNEFLQEKRRVGKEPRKNLEEMERRRRDGRVGNAVNREKEIHRKTRTGLNERKPMVMEATRNKKKNKTLPHKSRSERSMRKVHSEISVSAISALAQSERAVPSKIVNFDSGEMRAATKGRSEKKLKNEGSDEYYCKRLVAEICNLTTEELKENWIMSGQFENFEEISQELGQEILEILLRQFVDELLN